MIIKLDFIIFKRSVFVEKEKWVKKENIITE